MEEEYKTCNILVIWRGQKLNVEVNPSTTLKALGQKLQHLTNVKSDTIRLIVPNSSGNNSKLLSPFSDEHSSLSLQASSLLEGKFIRMMGVSVDEIEEVSRNLTKADMRIAGFDEEEKRLRQRMLKRPQTPLTTNLPQGEYIFCGFRTLHIPGIELNPPASAALRIMHTLASDAGIVALMNKHRWRVGIMTEMAPIGYVGVSPKCILGFNKNHGEEISLRLRTDDLKGFRKYESIKKTLLHELAHMVYSEHDANFYALDSQLNKEVAKLDWRKSRSHTLSGLRPSDYAEEECYVGTGDTASQKLGGETLDQLATARASSVAAAYRRLASASTNSLEEGHGVHVEPDPDHGFEVHAEPDPDDSVLNGFLQGGHLMEAGVDHNCDLGEAMEAEFYSRSPGNEITCEPDPDDGEMENSLPQVQYIGPKIGAEPDPDDCETTKVDLINRAGEPDPDDCLANIKVDNRAPPKSFAEPDPDDSLDNQIMQREPGPDDSNRGSMEPIDMQYSEPHCDDQELQRIQDPVAAVCSRLQKAIDMLKSEVNAMVAASVLQTLVKIIKNVIEHPDETKFKRLRKANPQFQRNVANYAAAMEVLNLVGFNEDTVSDEIGKSETYMVLKRNDPGLLWLAKSSLEMCIS